MEDEKKLKEKEGGVGSLFWFIQSFSACVAENKISLVAHITLHPL